MKYKLNPGLVASYDLWPGNGYGAGPIFWKVRDRRRNIREGKMHKKRRRKNTNRKGKQNKNTNKPHSHSADINKWIAGTNYPLTYGPGARTGLRFLITVCINIHGKYSTCRIWTCQCGHCVFVSTDFHAFTPPKINRLKKPSLPDIIV